MAQTLEQVTMSEPRTPSPEQRREAMSALADGQAAEADAAFALWASDAQARDAWATYHLIGDVLRSEDLAAHPAGEDFLAGIRSRLAAEPVVLAPAPAPALKAPQRPGLRRWIAPAAVAAGFVAVAAVLVVTRVVAPEDAGGAVLASTPAQPSAAGMQALQSGLAADAGDLPLQVVDGQLIRDARLDSYLRAHRGGLSAMPGGAVGRFETVVLER
jgi:sigma-E factor negative regulatory protein RseA